jgi:hypothetical protein
MEIHRIHRRPSGCRSDVIRISEARQLFVDDYLIAETDLERVFASAEPFAGNPVLKPETAIESDDGECPLACPFNDGVWFDPAEGLYKMWYHAGWFRGTAMATSRDGIEWERPDLGVVPGSNLVLPLEEGVRRDGCLVWFDQEAPLADERFKMFVYERWPGGEGGRVLSSSDGRRWRRRGPTGPCGDNTSFFYDPFRRKWVFSVRGFGPSGRARFRLERDDFFDCGWQEGEPVPWLECDGSDLPDPAIGFRPQLYDFNAAAYESLMLGICAVMKGPENDVCAARGIPKTIDLEWAFSRDGVRWARPASDAAFLRSSRLPGRWDRGYLHAAGGLYVRHGEALRFYYAGFSGESPRLQGPRTGSHPAANAMYAGGSTGFATLRLDGFAAMQATAGGTLTTCALLPPRGHLRVNCACPRGELRVEVLDAAGVPRPGFGREDALPFSGDATDARLRWRDQAILPQDAGPVRLRFHLREGSLYAFRVAGD